MTTHNDILRTASEKRASRSYNTAGLPTGFNYANGKTTSLTYNSRNMTTQINAGTAYNTGFGYDSRGNTTSITDYLPDTPVLTHKIDPSKGSLQTTTYGYSNNRMTSLTGSEAATYGYNGRGDMTTLMENNVTFTPEYDLLHNLRAYKQGSTTIAAYGYDGDGQRVLKTTGGVTTVYHHDKSGKLLSETDANGNRIADYLYVNGNMAAKVDNAGAVSYYHVDPAGTPIAITDSTGALVWRAEYLPFGEEQLLVNNKVNDKMFIGKEKDEETGLYYFGARYLQDRNARFVSVDPVGPVDEKSGKVNEKMLVDPQKLNRYAYALNNPYRYVDPDGRDVWSIGFGSSYFLGNIGPQARKDQQGVGKQAGFGIAFDTKTGEFFTFGTGAQANSDEGKVLGGNVGLGLVVGQLKGDKQDFLGKAQEESVTPGLFTITSVQAESGKKGTTFSFGGKGFGLSYISITSDTFDLGDRLREIFRRNEDTKKP